MNKWLLVETKGDEYGVFDIDVALIHLSKQAIEQILKVASVREDTVNELANAKACSDLCSYKVERDCINLSLEITVFDGLPDFFPYDTEGESLLKDGEEYKVVSDEVAPNVFNRQPVESTRAYYEDDGIRWTTIPKHSSTTLWTRTVPYEVFEKLLEEMSHA